MTINLVVSRFALSKAVSGAPIASRNVRYLSAQGIVAIEQLRDVLEEYRVKNYSREIPSRFKKDIVRAASTNTDGVAMDGLQRLLTNIDMQHKISPNHMEIIFRELGGESGVIPSDRMMKII